ncbi:UbiH 2-polyprenyl-6-methoxyphenol hydroxylase and related FAD-dependent oxidoreductases [Rhabdaerophilaceae bacterium]
MSESFARFHYARSPDQSAASPVRHPVIVIGAGPVGLTVAIDLTLRGHKAIVLDDSDRIGEGSRAICFAKKTLEIFDRIGIAGPLVAEGVSWKRGKVFQHDSLLYAFDLLPEEGHKMPAFINIQQFVVEKALVDRAMEIGVELRWKNRVVGLEQGINGAFLSIETPDGPYRIFADYVIACDGARSPVRTMLGLDFTGEVFEEQFLIADVKMSGDYPTERWFWFDPPFHPGGSALLHRQPKDIWRIDLQLPATADAEFERRPENVSLRIERMLGHHNFALEWVSIYRFRCLRLEHFVHDRVIFAGDAAHQVSPFGARGANSGIQDAENLAWKLAAILDGDSPSSLLLTYDMERGAAADDNIGHSTRSTDFIAPQSEVERRFRDAALALARTHDFAKKMVNSGRLSLPSVYTGSPLSTPDTGNWDGGPEPGAPVPDAPLPPGAGGPDFLCACLGQDFTLLCTDEATARVTPPGVVVLVTEPDSLLAHRFALKEGRAYLIRPDGYVAARFLAADKATIRTALRLARGKAEVAQ